MRLYRNPFTEKQSLGKKTAMIFEREADSISLGYTINKKSLNTSINLDAVSFFPGH